jgi:hypothetical protein
MGHPQSNARHRRTNSHSTDSMLYAAIVVVVLALLLPVASAQFAFQPYDSCPASSTAATATNAAVAATRLDIAAMSCVPCATGQVQDTVNPERCVCGTGFARAELATNEYAVTCTDCVAQGTAATRDGAGCMACSSNGTLSTTLRDCQCPAGYIIGQYFFFQHAAHVARVESLTVHCAMFLCPSVSRARSGRQSVRRR